MIYPQNFEDKIEFSSIREYIDGYCISSLGKDKLKNVRFSTNLDEITLQINQTLEAFKIPLCFAWQGYKYGWHTDFSEEGDSLFPFMMFEMELKKNTKELIDLLRTQSPFASIERNSAITNSLISIYTTFIKDIDNGTIKL